MMRFLLATVLLIGCTAAMREHGVVFGVGEWTSPNLSNESVQKSLKAAADAGATHIRLLSTWYQNSSSSTEIFPNENTASPLQSLSPARLEWTIKTARGVGMEVVLVCLVDLSWDNVAVNHRMNGTWGPAMSRADIGANFTSSEEWNAWFESYTRFVMSMAEVAARSEVVRLDVADGLGQAVMSRETQFRTLLSIVRSKYPKLKLGVSAIILSDEPSPLWWGQLDVIGCDLTHLSLASAVNESVEALTAAWAPHLVLLESIQAEFPNNSLVVSSVGFQSRPQCHRTPWATQLRANGIDCSAFPGCFDMVCQEHAYQATFEALGAMTPHHHHHLSSSLSLDGIYLWLWTADPTTGGTADSTFVPTGKPAEIVMRKAFGAHIPFHPKRGVMAQVQTDKKTRNGFVFGIGEWAGSAVRVDSPEVMQSLDNMVRTGANAVEFPITWFFVNRNDTRMFPIHDPTSLLRTPTDSELISLILAAKARGLRVCLSPMLDPTCQGWAYPEAQCYWRAEMGKGFGEKEWKEWFVGYSEFILHYAELAGSLRVPEGGALAVEEFHVSHELVTAETEGPPALWDELVKRVRVAYSGQVSVALNWGPFVVQGDPRQAVPLVPSWILPLDHIGVDCYFPLSEVPVPSETWVRPADTKAAFANAWAPYIAALANYSRATGGKSIVCTEVGYQSRPGSWAGPAGVLQYDTTDCSVWDQCVSSFSQAVAYDGLLSALTPQEWYGGVYLWLWRADPTAGGSSDDDFTPAGKKESLDVLRRFWV